MRRVIIFALSLGLASGIMGTFAFSQLFSGAGAAPMGPSVTVVSPLDEAGNVKVHEQGTADVNLTNSMVPVQVDNAGPIAVSVQGATPMQPATRFFSRNDPLVLMDWPTWDIDPPINASLIYVWTLPEEPMVVELKLGAGGSLGYMNLGYVGGVDPWTGADRPASRMIQLTQPIPIGAVKVWCWGMTDEGCGEHQILVAGN